MTQFHVAIPAWALCCVISGCGSGDQPLALPSAGTAASAGKGGHAASGDTGHDAGQSSAPTARQSAVAGDAAVSGAADAGIAAVGSAGASAAAMAGHGGASAAAMAGHGGVGAAGPIAGASGASPAASAPAEAPAGALDAGAQSDAPDPSLISVNIEGDEGCGSFAQSVSAGGSVYTALMNGVQLVRDSARGEMRDLDCTLTVHYEFPAGWAFHTTSTIVRGYANTDEASSLRLELSSGSLTNQRDFPTSTSSNFQLAVDDTVGMGDGSVCGEDSADIRVRVVASALSEGSALLQVDSIDGRVKWLRCP